MPRDGGAARILLHGRPGLAGRPDASQRRSFAAPKMTRPMLSVAKDLSRRRPAVGARRQWAAAAPALPNGGFASHTSGIIIRNIQPNSQNTSLTASVSACCVTTLSTMA